MHISAIIKQNGWTQKQAADHCGLTQPRINDLLNGRIDKFSPDALVNIVSQNKKDTRQRAADSISSTERRANTVYFLYGLTISVRSWDRLCRFSFLPPDL